ncbi:hypothetical protein KEM56_004193 [Ascosphaera pollenicola]|nr:hypothetical protein KEM56_004193 [Ascosphaera pollenicola]
MLIPRLTLPALLLALDVTSASPRKHNDHGHNEKQSSQTGGGGGGKGQQTFDGLTLPATAPVSSGFGGTQPHTPYTGTPTTMGALTAPVLATAITPQPAPSNTYVLDGQLHSPEPIAFQPNGGAGTNGTMPVYQPKSDYDMESLKIALYQEWIELDLFNYGLQKFSEKEFTAAGLTPDDRELIKFMADQEVGHATMLSNMIGPAAPQQCQYNYPFLTVKEFFDFCQKLTRFGESSVYGFLPHLDSREAAQLLLQSISTEARQQMAFRQMEGLFPMPVWFEVGVPQSWAWTLVSPYISSCPQNQTRLAWQNFPSLTILNNPNPMSKTGASDSNITIPGMSMANESAAIEPCGDSCKAAISNSRDTPLSQPGRQVNLVWEAPGKPTGPNNSYITTTSAKEPKYVMWVTQLNVTYTPLNQTGQVTGHNGTINGTANFAGVTNGSGEAGTAYSGVTYQPHSAAYLGDPAVNGTMFLAITDTNMYVTPFNLTMINPHIVAGPALYQAG